MSLCHLYNGIDYCTGIYSFDAVTEQPVLSAYCERADGILDALSIYQNKAPSNQ